MIKVSGKTRIHVPANTLWQVISNFGVAGQHLAGVTDCKVEGAGVGARRTLTHVDGSTIVEHLETVDEAAQQLSYTLLTDTPFSNCLTTISVRDLGPYQTELTWSATFEADGIPASEAVALLEVALAANCLVLKQFMEAGR